MPAASDLVRLTATEAVAALRAGEIAPAELIDAALARIEAVDGALNALPTLCAERARAAAKRLARAAPAPMDRGWLAGLPIAVKDLTDVAGVRTTYGSPVYAEHVPEASDALVERLEAHGALVLAKSNTPEFGAGANTFNEVFGETRNPWDTSLTCGGSSGGSAVALATGQVWLATGSDLGGSLRTPASFCSVVGLRPSPGRVAAATPGVASFDTMSVEGPMGRTVDDAALMLDAMSGDDVRDPLALPAPAVSFADAARSRRLPARAAFSPDLGVTPVDPEVRDVCSRAAARLGELGVAVAEAAPDLHDAPEIFHVLRAASFVRGLGELYASDRERLKPDIRWNVEAGLALTTAEVARAEAARGALYARVAAFLSEHELLLCPAACAPPFDVRIRWLREVDGQPFTTYIDWLRIASAVTLAACPVVALPCGFTRDGRPVGIQVVGRPRGEAAVLAAAAALEDALGLARRTPIDPRGPGA
jgi:amidase